MSLTNFFMNLLTSLILKIQIEILHWLISAFITHGKTLNLLIRTINLKISAPTWNYEFDLLDGSYSISDVQDQFEYIIKK